ncbi:MAG TPA: hypothetical protein VOA80_17115 [Thermoanaerobaculia bacterium]|nr:hypothetical protein [Thermoanaerobaculia bacterium]
MPCSLREAGLQWTAPKNSVVTVKVLANVTNIVRAEYNRAALPVNGNSTTFTVVEGNASLDLYLAGAPEDVEFVEDCGDGTTHHLDGYQNDFRPTPSFTIVGTAA